MATWQTVAAKENFSEMIDAARTDGPQVVLRHDEPVAIVLSPDDHRRLARQANVNFGDLLARSRLDVEDPDPVGMSLSGGA